MTRILNRTDLASAISYATALPEAPVKKYVTALIEAMRDTLISEGKLYLGIVTFKVRNKNARMGRNPRTGEDCIVTPRTTLSTVFHLDAKIGNRTAFVLFARDIHSVPVEVTHAFLVAIQQALLAEREIVLRLFGKFKRVTYAARQVHNPILRTYRTKEATTYMQFKTYPFLVKLLTSHYTLPN